MFSIEKRIFVFGRPLFLHQQVYQKEFVNVAFICSKLKSVKVFRQPQNVNGILGITSLNTQT